MSARVGKLITLPDLKGKRTRSHMAAEVTYSGEYMCELLDAARWAFLGPEMLAALVVVAAQEPKDTKLGQELRRILELAKYHRLDGHRERETGLPWFIDDEEVA